jgi:alpha-beta hydrolase superfamily lysophospholipase
MEPIELSTPTNPPLGATLWAPEGATAAALIHQGGGVHERDGNMHAVGFKSSLYKRVARLLGERGIASLRFDKRGSAEPAFYPHAYSVPQRIEDARAALSILRENEHTAGLPLFLIGHSEGAMVVAKLAESEEIAGVVSLCAPFGNVFDLGRLRAQRLVDDGNVQQRAKGRRALEYYARLEEYFKQGTKLSPEDFVEFARPYMEAGYNGWDSFEWLAGHWAGALASDPPKFGRRMLVVQGGRDARLYEDNVAKWQDWCDARKLADFLLIEQMGHDLNDARQKAFRVDEELIDAVAEWVKATVQRTA